MLPYSIAECGVFKVCQDGKIVAVKDVEQLCFIDDDKHKKLQEVFIRLELLKEHKDKKYFLAVFPIPAPMEYIEYNRPSVIANYKLTSMTFKKNSNSIINIFDLIKSYLFMPPEEAINFPFFNIGCHTENYNLKKNSFGTLIKNYAGDDIFFRSQSDIIQPASIDELKLYFKSYNEELSAETYLNFDKHIKSNSFFIFRTVYLPVKKNFSSTLEGLLAERETDSVYVKRDEYELVKQRFWTYRDYDFQLIYPNSPLHCPIPICSPEADSINALTIIINNFIYLGNSMNNYYFDTKQYFFNKPVIVSNRVRIKVPMKQVNYDISNLYPIGYTIISTKKILNNIRVNNLRMLLPNEKHNEEILFLTILLILLILVTKLFLKFNSFEIAIMAPCFFGACLSGSPVFIVSAMIFMCTLYKLRYECHTFRFRIIDLLFFIIFSVISFFDVFIGKFIQIHAAFLISLLVFGMIYLKEVNLKFKQREADKLRIQN
jgi:hypothetical protein